MKKIISEISKYYNDKIVEFGANSNGVDWNGIESHNLRFSQLCKIITTQNYSVLDYGCGYGALVDYLDQSFPSFEYLGFDIAEEMIQAGNDKFDTRKTIAFKGNICDITPKDYCIASGIFNVKLNNHEEEWKRYIIETLDSMNKLSTKGFSFNLLTSYSDKDFMKDYLFYAEPEWLFKHCKENYSKQVAILHDYPLYEFTILVRK
jgi:SAM-dependent methyltransferase